MPKSLKIIVLYLIFCNNLVFAIEKLEIKKITANHKNIELTQNPISIDLISKNNDFFVEFIPLLGDSVDYKYQLTNYELDWTETDFPTLRYMNLPEGKYQLFVIARQNNLEKAHYYLNINVEKSISENWWFYPMLAFYGLLLIGGGIYLFFLYNFRQKMKVQKIRNKLAADLHDEIGSSLSSIAMSSNFIQNKLKNESAEVKEILSQIKVDSEDTVNTIRDTVWALNPENDSFEIFIEKIRSFALQILVNQGIELHFENKVPEPKSIKLNLDTRKNFFLIAKEAINNIAKHSKATKVNIVFEQKNDFILLTISDNGIGFNLQENCEGNGLKNFKKRAKESFIEIKIDSEIGKGTKIYLEVPLL